MMQCCNVVEARITILFGNGLRIENSACRIYY